MPTADENSDSSDDGVVDLQLLVPPRRRDAHRTHVPMRPGGDIVLLILASLVTLAACLLSVRGSEQVLIPLLDQPIPGICSFKRVTGWDCPGCGLTRSFVSFAHGDVVAAWHFNPASVLFFPLVVLQIPYRSWQLWRVYRGQPRIELGGWGIGLAGALVAAVLGQWVVRALDRLLT